MIASVLASSTLLFSLGSAQPVASSISTLLSSLGPAPKTDPRFTNWQAPGHGDVRSPCPGLNTLANHGFINHNGKNLTIPGLLTGLAAGMNIGPDFSVAIGAAGLLSSPNPFGGSFDLNDLDQHNFPIEHDASLSRQDAFFGNDYSFYNPYWQDVLAQYNGYGGKTALQPAANAIANRTATSRSNNPTFTFGPREYIFRFGESALYLQAMGANDFDGVTRLDWVRSLFEQEKLPVALGWTPRAEPITLLSLGQGVFELSPLVPGAPAEAVQVTIDSYKDALELVVGGSEVLNNLTSGYAAAVGL